MMGRHKIPTELKVLNGNPGKRSINPDEVKPAPIADPCPKWFDKYAKAVWIEMAPKMEKYGLLTDIDTLDFQNLCVSAGIIRKAYADLKKLKVLTGTTPSGYRQQLPEVGIINSAIKNVTALSAKFGLSPADRAGLADPKAIEKRGKMSKLLSG
jgi:P27 family predicted phage terminase small subunit